MKTSALISPSSKRKLPNWVAMTRTHRTLLDGDTEVLLKIPLVIHAVIPREPVAAAQLVLELQLTEFGPSLRHIRFVLVILHGRPELPAHDDHAVPCNRRLSNTKQRIAREGCSSCERI